MRAGGEAGGELGRALGERAQQPCTENISCESILQPVTPVTAVTAVTIFTGPHTENISCESCHVMDEVTQPADACLIEVGGRALIDYAIVSRCLAPYVIQFDVVPPNNLTRCATPPPPSPTRSRSRRSWSEPCP